MDAACHANHHGRGMPLRPSIHKPLWLPECKNKVMLEVFERGKIYFFYRPRVEKKKVRQFEDVQRLIVILSSDRQKTVPDVNRRT